MRIRLRCLVCGRFVERRANLRSCREPEHGDLRTDLQCKAAYWNRKAVRPKTKPGPQKTDLARFTAQTVAASSMAELQGI
jgi:hypothetical protein